MSCTEIYTFDKNGDAHHYGNVRNAWRGAMAVWRIMEERYLPPYIPDYVRPCWWFHEGITQEEMNKHLGYVPSRLSPLTPEECKEEVWALVNNDAVPEKERIVLGTTFDKVLVKREHIPTVIEAFRSFCGDTTLPEQADLLEKIMQDPDVIAVGWNQTSVNADNWTEYYFDGETMEYKPYNCLTGADHEWLLEDEVAENGDTL